MKTEKENVEKTREEKVKRLLATVGNDTFIKYFYPFKNRSGNRDNIELIEVFKKNEEIWNYNAASAKATNGKRIFRLKYELAALEYIINHANENKVGTDIKEKALKIYNEYKKL